MTVAVVVMLNALIAMMSNTYTRVEENSEIEWRVSRTKMMAEYMTKSATLPPPFNLVPTLKTLKKLIQIPYDCFNEEAKRRKQMVRWFYNIFFENSNILNDFHAKHKECIHIGLNPLWFGEPKRKQGVYSKNTPNKHKRCT